MARGQRKTIEVKIAEKEEVIKSLKTRLKAEQRELDELYKEKRDVDLKMLHEVLAEANMSASDAADVIKGYLQNQESQEEYHEGQE